MRQTIRHSVEALFAVAAVAWLASAQLPLLGLASSALLFLLPVLLAATRGGVAPGLVAALASASAYNFFLLEPRFTFRVHQLDNLVSVVVLVAVALVTSRLATRLMTREAEAQERARLSGESAELSALLSGHPAKVALERGIEFLESRYATVRLLVGEVPPQSDGAFSSLDAASAAWALHNGDVTGHGSEVMPAAEWTFFPLGPGNRSDAVVAALARPADGRTRQASELEHLRQLCLLLGQCHDRNALEAERREREVLEQADRLRRAFLASLAHDFRTPLTIITGRLAHLVEGSDEARDALVAAQRLDRMMSDLVGAARIESGSLVPAMENIDLVDVVSAACDGLTVPKSIILERQIPADVPFISGDAVLLHHVLINLLDNGIRHARSKVTVSAYCEDKRVLLSVSDDGSGIPDGDRERIFERFVRAEGSDMTTGSGLGLAIVKGFADAMAMEVRPERSPTGGARFTLVATISETAGT